MPGGGSSPAVIQYPNLLAQVWGGLVTGEEPTLATVSTAAPGQSITFANLDTSHILMDELSAALDAGSPFADVAAVDPTDVVDKVDEERDRLLTLIAGLDLDDPSTFIHDLADDASTIATDHVVSTAAAVTAFEARRQAEVSRAMSLVMAGYWEANAVVGTQMGMALSNVVAQNEKEVSNFDAQLSTQKAAYTMQLTDSMVRTAAMLWELAIKGTHVAQETGRFRITALQDQQNIDLTYLVKNQLWNLDLYDYGFKALAALGGASVIPRAQTQGERILGAVSNAVSTGLGMGASFGPAAGVAGFAGSLAMGGIGALIDATSSR
jgi:hypothetical protein